MSIFTSAGIVVLAMIIMASLQLSPGIFALFYHSISGKYSKKRVSDLSLFFIMGAETISACLFLCVCYFANLVFFYENCPEHSIFAWIAVGMLVVLAFASFFCYFRKGPGTQLFISRRLASALDSKAQIAKTRSDAFTIGALSNIPELVFTFPLYLITAVDIMEINARFYSSSILTLLYILTPTIALFIIRWRFKSGHNLAEIQRSRVKDKPFVRFIIPLCYLTIAIIIICFRILT